MATNFYHSEQTVHFGDPPSVYEGFYCTTSSASGSVECFPVGKREAFEKKVAKIFGANDPDMPDVLKNTFRLAASACMAFGGDSDDDRQWGRDMFREEMTVHYVGRTAEECAELYDAVEEAFQECLHGD